MNNLKYYYAYNINATFNKANSYKSKEIKLAKLNQLDK